MGKVTIVKKIVNPMEGIGVTKDQFDRTIQRVKIKVQNEKILLEKIKAGERSSSISM